MKTFKRLQIPAQLISLCVWMSACGGGPVISGHIEGLGNDSVVIELTQIPESGDVVDASALIETRITVAARDGKFELDSAIKHPTDIIIIPRPLIEQRADGGEYWMDTRQIHLLLMPGERAAVKGSIKDKVLDYEVSGTAFNREISQLRRKQLPLDVQADSLNLLIERSMNQFIERGSEDKAQLEQREQLFEQRKRLYERMRLHTYEQIRSNPDAVSAGYLTLSLPLDSAATYYALLGERAKAGIFGNYLREKLAKADDYNKVKEAGEMVVAGADAPRFTLKSSDGGELSLTDITDKYIVLDFWGTWCGWCVAGFPKMKEYYERYRGKVEFIGINCGDPEQKWLETVKKEGLPWKNVIENRDAKDKISVLYPVLAYPTKVIIDKDYKIAGIFEGEDEAFYEKLDELLK